MRSQVFFGLDESILHQLLGRSVLDIPIGDPRGVNDCIYRQIYSYSNSTLETKVAVDSVLLVMSWRNACRQAHVILGYEFAVPFFQGPLV